MKIIITGARGNLGSNVEKQALNFGITPISIGRHRWSNINDISGEIDAVLHCAADIKGDFCFSPKSYLDSNLHTTIDMLETCAKKQIKNFYFTSSCAVYGKSSQTYEAQPRQPISLNGYIKSINEELIEKFCLQNNISFTIFRIFNLYGGEDQFSVVSRLISAARNKKPFKLINKGLDERDFVHVYDVANIICKTIIAVNSPTILNIGTGKSTKISDIKSAIEDRFGPVNVSNSSQIVNAVSKADTRLLKQFMGNITFRNILDEINIL